MNRIRFSRVNKPASEPSAPDARPAAEHTMPAADQPALTLANVPLSHEDRELIEQVQMRLLSESTSVNAKYDQDHYTRRIALLVSEQLEIIGRVISDRERARLTRIAQAELLGLGPLEPLLADDSISEIMVNGPDQIWVERNGKLVETSARFTDDDHVRRIIDRIISPLGRRCDETMPMVDARLPDGSRVNAIIPPLCLNGPSLTIRKFFKTPLSGADLVRRGTHRQ
jgi:pilus assembly protein CpaF